MTDIKKYAPYSLTKLQTANSCTLRFKWEYIDKLPKRAVSGSAGRLGASAHKILELMLKGETYERAFKVGAEDQKLVFNEIESLACMKDSIVEFLTRIGKWKESHPVDKQFIELKFGIDENMQAVDFWSKSALLRGAWDMGLKLKDRSLVILDHKSGAEKATSSYTDQLNIYAASGLVLFPDISGVDTRLHFLQSKSIVNGPYIKSDQIRNEIFPWLLKFITDSVIHVDSKTAEPTKSWACNYCPYKTICPAWNDTKVATPIVVDVPLNKNDPSNI